MGKGKFYEAMRAKYQEMYGIDINVKGFIQHRESARRIQLREDKGKSGVPRANSDYDQALDRWIELSDDHERLLKEEKAAKGSKAEAEKIEAIQTREDMIHGFANKRKQREDENQFRIYQRDNEGEHAEDASQIVTLSGKFGKLFT